MDFVDPRDAPGVGTPVRGGVTYREAHLAMEMICDQSAIEAMLSMEVVEVNPVIDEVNRTADLAVELIHVRTGKAHLMKLRVAVIYGGRTRRARRFAALGRSPSSTPWTPTSTRRSNILIDRQGKW